MLARLQKLIMICLVAAAIVWAASFDAIKLADNLKAIFSAVEGAKPSTAKGQFVKTVFITTTMGPSVKVNVTA